MTLAVIEIPNTTVSRYEVNVMSQVTEVSQSQCHQNEANLVCRIV